MLPKKNRLSKKEFEYTFVNGEAFHTSLFTFKVVKNTEIHKIGVSVPKKTLSLAVWRNKIKRKIFTGVERAISRDLNIWLICIVKKHIQKKDLTNENIQRDIQEFKESLL
jgi:ribonuclease P protein component